MFNLPRIGGNTVATIDINTDLSRAHPIGETGAGYGFPAIVECGGESYDFADQYQSTPPDFRDVGDVTIRLIREGLATDPLLPADVCRSIAKFMRTARWGTENCDCTAFAMGATGTKIDRIAPGAYAPIENLSSLRAGDLLAVGRANFGNTDLDHYAVALGVGEMALNVTGKGGALAATPIAHFPAIYPKSSIYRVENGKR